MRPRPDGKQPRPFNLEAFQGRIRSAYIRKKMPHACLLVNGKMLHRPGKMQRLQPLRQKMPAGRYLWKTGLSLHRRPRQMHGLPRLSLKLQILSNRKGVIYREIENENK